MASYLRFNEIFQTTGKPAKPEGPLVASDITADSVKLSWQPSKSDGGSPIKEYIVEKYDKRRLSWSKIGTVPVDDQTLSFVVPKLIEGTPYQFRVVAVNDEGASEPLVTDTEIKPKKAPGNQLLYERCRLKM